MGSDAAASDGIGACTHRWGKDGARNSAGEAPMTEGRGETPCVRMPVRSVPSRAPTARACDPGAVPARRALAAAVDEPSKTLTAPSRHHRSAAAPGTDHAQAQRHGGAAGLHDAHASAPGQQHSERLGLLQGLSSTALARVATAPIERPPLTLLWPSSLVRRRVCSVDLIVCVFNREKSAGPARTGYSITMTVPREEFANSRFHAPRAENTLGHAQGLPQPATSRHCTRRSEIPDESTSLKSGCSARWARRPGIFTSHGQR
jgi:hypothetical protein